MPHEATVRKAPQLSVPGTEPQSLFNREQKVGSSSGVQAQTFVPLQVCGPVQVPHEATVREAPQLSASVTAPQVLPRREQNTVSVSGAQAHTFDPQISVPVHVPHEAAVRVVPQLSSAVSEPQFLPSREQKLVLVSGAQPHRLGVTPPQVCVPLQEPQEVTERDAPQLSVAVTGPQFAFARVQNAGSLSGAQLQTRLEPHVSG